MDAGSFGRLRFARSAGASEDEEVVVKSFRNLEKVLVTVPSELEVASILWAKSILVTEAAHPLVLARAGAPSGEEAAE